MIRLGELSYLSVPEETRDQPLITLFKGLFYFFHRDKPGQYGLRTPTASAVARGTELNVQINNDGTSTFSLLDGLAEISAGPERVELEGKEQVVIAPGKAPVRTAVLNAVNVIQWCLYYPAVLCLNDLDLDPAAQAALGESLVAYQAGDLKTALATFPAGRVPATPAEKVYLAALLISIGEIEQGKSFLDGIGREEGKLWRVRESLLTLVAAVLNQPSPGAPASADRLATEWLADSYWQQSRSKLPEALAAAQKARELAPDSGFAWARAAELEFCFGGISKARAALERSLELAPRNAQALALKGFLLSASGKVTEAREFFDKAIAADSALGNAWLGRGLCRMRRGDSAGGMKDLMVAAALEPQRALLRSYLGKAYTAADDYSFASKELKLAIGLDSKDPTAWLYSALLKQQQNRINAAIGDLETSEALNDNRSVFRSRLLLDEDLAVRSANLAAIYRDAGMTDVSVREASRAVTYDYANAAAHLFLSDSYNDLRDPTRFNLRYETVWFNELLLANLLSPIGGGRLSQHVSQQEYSSLFQADGLGIANSTLGRSDNKSVTELVSQYGTFGGTSYALDLDYQHNGGVRPNNGLDSIEWYTTVKQQITPQDTLLALVKYEDYHSGDNFQYYDQTNARPNFRFDEYQQPIVVGGWHHEWSPGVHTLLLGGWLSTEQHFSDLAAPQLLLIRNTSAISLAGSAPFDVNYHSEFEIYLAELNQLFQWNRVTLSLGGRWQGGSFQTQAQFTNPPSLLAPLFSNPVAQASLNEGFNRLSSLSN
jgi:tetratricopeptide (TPR) repeat protein